MARRRRSSLALSAEQARQALMVLVQEGKLRMSEVRQALQRRDRMVRALRDRLASLERGLGRIGRQFKESPLPMGQGARAGVTKRVRKKPRISAATRKLYQQQGRYMAALRPLSKKQRAKVKTIRENAGVRAAIAAAKRLGSQSS